MSCALALLTAAATSSCTTIGSQCASAAIEMGARVCIAVICDDDGEGELVTADGDVADVAPEPRREAPAPDWQPHPGACDVVREGGRTTIACADGTRAVFVGDGAGELVEHDQASEEEGCWGGSVVRQGLDVDASGALAPTEVTGRTVDCPEREGVRAPTLLGHLAIHGADDVMRVAGRRALTGGLHIRSATLVKLALPQLQSIGGTLRIDGVPALESVSASSLAMVGGDVVVSRASSLAELSLPALTRVGGSVIVVENPRLPHRSLEELVFQLSRKGFAGPVDLAGNAPVE